MQHHQQDKLFEVQRRKLLKRYEDAKQEFRASTKPYKSTAQVVFTVQNPLPAGTNPTMAHLVALQGQRLNFFAYGINDQISFADGQRLATESDTNQSKANKTNGVEDFVIEGVSASAKSIRVQYFKDSDVPAIPALKALLPETLSLYLGRAPVLDPGALIVPPQVQSPANLEDVLYEAVKPHFAVEFEWDRTRVDKIGSLQEFTEGGAKSYLRSSGVASANKHDRYTIPEGYIWRREGEPDNQLVVRAQLTDSVVIPINLVTLQLTTSTNGGPHASTPLAIYLDIQMKLHGLSVGIPSKN
jgi:hypothetical protein